MLTCTIVIGNVPVEFKEKEKLLAIVGKNQVTTELVNICDEIYMFELDLNFIKAIIEELRKKYIVSQILVYDRKFKSLEKKT